MTKRDKDAELKLRVARYFWHLGYVSPMEVAMSSREIVQGELKRYDLTDLDVVGIKFDSDLSSRVIIGDCKSGRTSAVTRLFWLRGVMDYFSAERAYLSMPDIGRECRAVALRLGISLLDSANIAKYEREKELLSDVSFAFSLAGYDKKRALWGLDLPKGHQATSDEQRIARLYQFLSYRYWFQDEYLNVQQTITAFSDAADALARYLDRPRVRMVAYRGLTLLSIALLRMCGSVISIKPDEIHNEIRRYIFGGAGNAKERVRLMGLLSEVSGHRVPLEPPYYESLLELSSRLISFSHYAREIPRYSELVLNETVLGERANSVESLLGPAYNVDTLKLTKDVAEFLCRASGLEIRNFEALMAQ